MSLQPKENEPEKRRKMQKDENDESNFKNLFDFKKGGSVNLSNEKVIAFIKKSFNIENRELLFKNFKDFICDENKKSEFLSLFYHSYESEDAEINENKENESTQLRYFADTRVCYNCGEVGHVEGKCPLKTQQVCILCGYNDHIRYNCPQIICAKCGLCGHRYRDCKEEIDRRKRYMICTRCPNKHTVPDCSLIWRRYKFDKLNRNEIRMSCCNCLKKDHFVDDCDGKRSKNGIFTGFYDQLIYHRRWNDNLRRDY